MSAGWDLLLTAVRALLLVLGLVTTAVSFRAYRVERTRYLRNATVGFGFITLGVLVEGVLYQATALTLTQVHVVESLALACGFAVLLWSLLR